MYVVINETEYTAIKALSFAPEMDITGDALPIDEFAVDIVTADSIATGQQVGLYDDLDQIWALYWIISADRVDGATVRVTARSPLALLDRIQLAEAMYSAEPLADALEDVFTSLGPGWTAGIDYSVDSSFESTTLTGYCPAQTARERLQWIAFVIGAYVSTWGDDDVKILPLSSTDTLIPTSDTFWKPTLSYGSVVTAITITAYTFTASSTQSDSDYTSYSFPPGYVVTEQDFTLVNPDALASDAPNVIEVRDVYLVNSSNVSGLLSHLAQYWFKRLEVEADVVNNRSYFPGQRVTLSVSRDKMASGYIKSAVFSFGVQARAKLHLMAAENRPAAELVVTYVCNNAVLGQQRYMLPVGYVYQIDTVYLDITQDGHRYIYRPTTAQITGTMASSGNTATVTYAVALEQYNRALRIISVDGVTATTESGGNVAVIQ